MVVKLDIDAEAGWYAGTDFDFKFSLFEDEGLSDPLDISARTLLWQLRTDIENENLISKTTPTDIAVTNGVGGLCTVHILAEDTIDLKEGWYNYAIMTSDPPRVITTAGAIYLNKAATP